MDSRAETQTLLSVGVDEGEVHGQVTETKQEEQQNDREPKKETQRLEPVSIASFARSAIHHKTKQEQD